MANQRTASLSKPKAQPKLFLVHYGYYQPGDIWEQHGAAHVVATTAKEARAIFKALLWVRKTPKVHIDGILEVQVAGYSIKVKVSKTLQAPPERLGYSA